MSFFRKTSVPFRLQIGSYFIPLWLAGYILFPNLKSGDARSQFLILPPEVIRMLLGMGLMSVAVHRALTHPLQRRARGLMLLWGWALFR